MGDQQQQQQKRQQKRPEEQKPQHQNMEDHSKQHQAQERQQSESQPINVTDVVNPTTTLDSTRGGGIGGRGESRTTSGTRKTNSNFSELFQRVFLGSESTTFAPTDLPSAIERNKRSPLNVRRYAVMYLRDNQEKERGYWRNTMEFILTSAGFAMGLGNVWRYPWLVYEFGGGTFVFAYWVILLTIAYPTLLYELALGQFTSRGPVHIWRSILPAFEGIGYVLLFVSGLCWIYYNALFAVAIFYIGSSFNSPWRHCRSPWNSEYCFDVDSYKTCVGDDYNKWYVKTKCYNSTNINLLMEQIHGCWENGSDNYRRGVNSSHWVCSFKLHFDFTTKVNPCALVNKAIYNNNQHHSALLTKSECRALYSLFSSTDECTNREHELTADTLSGRPLTVHMDFRFRTGGNFDKMLKAARLMDRIFKRGNFTLIDFFTLYCDKMQPEVMTMECFKGIIDPDESYSSEEYYKYNVDKSEGVSQYSSGLVVSWFFAWAIVALSMHNGFKTIGKLSYFTVSLPFLMILVLDMIAVTLVGFESGIDFYLTTKWCKLKNPTLWLRALSQVFFSLSLGHGGMPNIASYNRFQQDIVRDSIIISLLDCMFSFFAGFGIFGVIGFMAYQVQTKVPLILRGSSTGVAFVVFAQSTCTLPGGQALAIFFYATLFILALSSEIVGMEVLATFVCDEFPITRRRRWVFVVPMCILFSIAGIPLVSRRCMTLVNFVDTGLFSYLVPILAFSKIVLVMYVYGMLDFIKDIRMMSGINTLGNPTRDLFYYITSTKLRFYLYFTWGFLVPLGLALIIMSELYFMSGWFKIGSFLSTTVTAIILVILGFIVSCCYRGYRGKALIRPGLFWGPVRNENRWGDRYAPFTDTRGLSNARLTTLRDIEDTMAANNRKSLTPSDLFEEMAAENSGGRYLHDPLQLPTFDETDTDGSRKPPKRPEPASRVEPKQTKPAAEESRKADLTGPKEKLVDRKVTNETESNKTEDKTNDGTSERHRQEQTKGKLKKDDSGVGTTEIASTDDGDDDDDADDETI